MDISRIPDYQDSLPEYDDEVLNAGWVPQLKEARRLQDAQKKALSEEDTLVDPETFLRAAYLYQE